MKQKPRLAVFDFADCEGCELEIADLEEEILDLIDIVDIIIKHNISILKGLYNYNLLYILCISVFLTFFSITQKVEYQPKFDIKPSILGYFTGIDTE